jgi:hypothetical protein
MAAPKRCATQRPRPIQKRKTHGEAKDRPGNDPPQGKPSRKKKPYPGEDYLDREPPKTKIGNTRNIQRRTTNGRAMWR